MKRFFSIITVIAFLVSSSVLAQPAPGGGGKDADQFIKDSFQDITIVMGVGVSGAILGLSTLSFVEEPSDHLKNIVYGASIGVIIGVGVVAWKQANKSHDYYWDNADGEASAGLQYDTKSRRKWHYESFSSNNSKLVALAPQVLSLTFTF